MASWAHGERERRGAVRRLRPPSQDLWAAVDSLVDRAPRISALAFHGLHLLAARRYRQTGRLVPRDLAAAEKNAAVASLVAPIVLREARQAYDRTIVLMKGPEVAVKYRDPVLVRSATSTSSSRTQGRLGARSSRRGSYPQGHPTPSR